MGAIIDVDVDVEVKVSDNLQKFRIPVHVNTAVIGTGHGKSLLHKSIVYDVLKGRARSLSPLVVIFPSLE